MSTSAKPIPIGARGRRFVLELPLESPDGFGGVVRTYAAGPQLWRAIELLRGDERVRAAHSEQAVTHRVTLRYRDGVTAAMRLVRGLRRFAIRSAADPDGSRRELVCLVEEISP
ncbi:MAG: phage head closure protein [Microvirga sp.]|nr:phage head closure protein [Beijerinckiaceae bacterium]